MSTHTCSDGLVDRRGESVDVGLKRLQQAASHDHDPLGEFLDRIITELTAGSPADDIADWSWTFPWLQSSIHDESSAPSGSDCRLGDAGPAGR